MKKKSVKLQFKKERNWNEKFMIYGKTIILLFYKLI